MTSSVSCVLPVITSAIVNKFASFRLQMPFSSWHHPFSPCEKVPMSEKEKCSLTRAMLCSLTSESSAESVNCPYLYKQNITSPPHFQTYIHTEKDMMICSKLNAFICKGCFPWIITMMYWCSLCHTWIVWIIIVSRRVALDDFMMHISWFWCGTCSACRPAPMTSLPSQPCWPLFLRDSKAPCWFTVRTAYRQINTFTAHTAILITVSNT